MPDYDDLYKNYVHEDNWMTQEEAEHKVRMQALEDEEREWEKRQKELDDYNKD